MMMIYSVIGVTVGIIIGILLPDFQLGPAYSQLLAIALLACLDTVFGGCRASLEKNFDNQMFLIGFFTNAALAAIFVYIGARLGIDLYFVALLTFGMRIFQNTAAIRRLLLLRRKPVVEN